MFLYPRVAVQAAIVTLLVALPMPAQQMNPAGHMHSGPVPQEILHRPVVLRSGIGQAHQKVSTASSRAQAFYDQGLAYLHSYVWVEAARSFYQALRLDPNLGMAYVGLADAYIGLQDIHEARAACDKAQVLASHMSAGEREWLQIRQHEVASLQQPEEYAAYRQSIDEAIQSTPHDPWLLVQRGLAAEASPFTHGQASGAESLEFYKRALSIDPKNLAALHYSVHAEENLGDLKQALQDSSVYAGLAPAIPHAVHMHGHELMRVGQTEAAIREYQRTNQLEENYYRLEKIPAQYDWHHAHNLQLLALSYELLGKVRTTEVLLKQAFALPAYTEFLEYNRRVWPEFLIGRGRYEDALEPCRKLAESQWPMARLAGHTLWGEALLGLSRMEDAKEQLALAEAESQHLPEKILSVLPYPATLRAGILLHNNQVEEGEQLMVNVEKSLTSMPGPDGWIAAIFALESIAREAREAGDWDLVRYTAEQMLQHDPYYAGGHFAIGLVAEHAGEGAGATPMFAQAEKLWSQGDPDLPELVATRKKLAALR